MKTINLKPYFKPCRDINGNENMNVKIGETIVCFSRRAKEDCWNDFVMYLREGRKNKSLCLAFGGAWNLKGLKFTATLPEELKAAK